MNGGDSGPDVAREPTRPAGMRVRTVWRAVWVLAAVGIGTLSILAWLWRDGRLPSVRDAEPSPGALVAYAGVVPGAGSGPLVSPRSVSTDDSSLFVTEPDTGRIWVFGLDGRFVRSLALETTDTVYPIDAVTVGETLYVIDAAGKRVFAMDHAGRGVRRVAESLAQPSALARTDGGLLIADALTGLWRLDVATGTLTTVAGAEATRGFTGGIAPDAGRVLLTDTGGSRVLEISVGNGDVAAFGERVNLPRGIAVDSERRVWVADVLGGTVMAFDRSGTLLGGIEEERVAGVDRFGLGSPQGVTYSESAGRLYVVDALAGRVVAYTLAR